MLMTPPALSQTDPLGAPMDKAAKTTNPALFPLRLTTQSPAAIDAFIAAQRRQMSLLVEAFIFGSDRSSRRLYESLMQDCSDFAARQPETRDLR